MVPAAPAASPRVSLSMVPRYPGRRPVNVRELGVEGGGKFPAGKAAFLAACHEGWRKAEQMHRAGQ